MQIRDRLTDALKAAVRARDRDAVSALRSAMAALDNAAAVDAPAVSGTELAVEHTPVGLGTTEVPRRSLSDSEAFELICREIGERLEAASRYDAAGKTAAAAAARAGAAAVERAISG
jgi:uncharacterized protein YqeY